MCCKQLGLRVKAEGLGLGVGIGLNDHTCGDRSSGSINDGGVEMGLAEGSCHTSSYSQHLSEGILIPMSHLQQPHSGLELIYRQMQTATQANADCKLMRKTSVLQPVCHRLYQDDGRGGTLVRSPS